MVELYLHHIKPEHWNHYNNLILENVLPVTKMEELSEVEVTDPNIQNKITTLDYKNAYLYWHYCRVFEGVHDEEDSKVALSDCSIGYYTYLHQYPISFMKTTLREIIETYIEEKFIPQYESFLNLDDTVILIPPQITEVPLADLIYYKTEQKILYFTDLVDNLIRYRTQVFPIRTLYSPPVSYLDMDSINFVTYYDNQWHTYET